MTYAYVRVSTDAQNTENQKHEIEKFCRTKKVHVDEWVLEKISGTTDPQKRHLGDLMNRIQKDDLLICTELSRLGRSLLMIMNTLDYFSKHNVKVWTIKDNFKLEDDITSKVISFAFGLSAEIERQLISNRTKTGLERAKAQGIHLGRKKGQKSSYYKLDSKSAYIEERIKAGVKINHLRKELNVDWSTLNRHIIRMGLKDKVNGIQYKTKKRLEEMKMKEEEEKE